MLWMSGGASCLYPRFPRRRSRNSLSRCHRRNHRVRSRARSKARLRSGMVELAKSRSGLVLARRIPGAVRRCIGVMRTRTALRRGRQVPSRRMLRSHLIFRLPSPTAMAGRLKASAVGLGTRAMIARKVLVRLKCPAADPAKMETIRVTLAGPLHSDLVLRADRRRWSR